MGLTKSCSLVFLFVHGDPGGCGISSSSCDQCGRMNSEGSGFVSKAVRLRKRHSDLRMEAPSRTPAQEQVGGHGCHPDAGCLQAILRAHELLVRRPFAFSDTSSIL